MVKSQKNRHRAKSTCSIMLRSRTTSEAALQAPATAPVKERRGGIDLEASPGSPKAAVRAAKPDAHGTWTEISARQSHPYRPLRLRGVGGGSVVPLDGDRLARGARAGAGRLGGVPVTRWDRVR